MQLLSPSSVSFQFYQMSLRGSLSPSSLSIASIMICLICITTLPFAKPHSQIEEACEKYNTIFTNGTQSCVSILSTFLGRDSNLSTIALSGMEFAKEKMSETGETIRNKLKDKSLKPRFYGALRTCMRLYNEASYSFGFGLVAFKEQNYETVYYRWLNGAFYDVIQCERELNMVGVKGEELGIKTEYMLEVLKSANAAFHFFANK